MLAELGATRVCLVPGGSLGATLETRRGVRLVPGDSLSESLSDSLSANLETRKGCPRKPMACLWNCVVC